MDKEHKQTDKRLAIMEKHLTQVYERANKDVGKNWKEYLDKVNEEITNLQKEYDDAKLSGDKDLIKKAGMKLSSTKREKTMLNKHYKNLTNQLAEELLHVNETALAYVNHQLPDIYSLNYNRLAETVDGIGGYSFELTDPNTVRNLTTRNNNLLPYKKVDGKKDIRWNTKKINNEVLQGILLGEPMDKIAKRLGTVLDMNKSSAIRNARTSVTSAENKGRQDSYEQAEKNGIQLEKEWVSTHDSRTRYSHSMLNGQKVPIGEKFKSVLGELEYPADPNGVPADIYNCRCTVVASVIGFDKIQVEEAMEERTYKVENLFGEIADKNLNKELAKMDSETAKHYRDAIINAKKEYTENCTSYSSSKNVINYNKDEYKEMEGWVSIHETTHYLDFNKKFNAKIKYDRWVKQRDTNGFVLRDENGKMIKKYEPEYEEISFDSISSYLLTKYNLDIYESENVSVNLFKEDSKALFKTIGCDRHASKNEKFDAFMKKRDEWIKKYGDNDLEHVTDVISGLTNDEFEVSLIGGHYKDYWEKNPYGLVSESLASYAFLRATGRTDLLELEKTLAPNLFKLLEEGYEKLWE